MKEFIELVEYEGNVYNCNAEDFTAKNLDAIIKLMDYNKGNKVNMIFCSQDFLNWFKINFSINKGGQIAMFKMDVRNAITYVTDFSLHRGSYEFHVVVKAGIEGAVIVPETAGSNEELAANSFLIREQ